jgi:uncharacterized protein (TIGR03032 family)
MEHKVMSDSDEPLRSVHTDSVPSILERLGMSLLISTYQAGFVVLLRHDAGVLNTHFRRFSRPMGMAVDGNRLAVGAAIDIAEYRVMGAVTNRLDPPGKHDACYLPRNTHVTGDIDIHEMVWSNEDLWFVNTRFSYLCTLDSEHSFVPRWRPPFVSQLAPEDRCHLNGLCLIEGKPKYVTALGTTDQVEGWRKDKLTGGVLMDVESNEVVCRGLCMPHSPRMHDGRLWLLDSGKGSIGTVDLQKGSFEEVCQLDGFTRGLSFAGRFAFVGLSQVREKAVFSGIPIGVRLQEKERTCGAAVVDLESGQQVGFVHFQGDVQEIFSVEMLPYRFPELLEWDSELLNNTYALPDEALRDVAQ